MTWSSLKGIWTNDLTKFLSMHLTIAKCRVAGVLVHVRFVCTYRNISEGIALDDIVLKGPAGRVLPLQAYWAWICITKDRNAQALDFTFTPYTLHLHRETEFTPTYTRLSSPLHLNPDAVTRSPRHCVAVEKRSSLPGEEKCMSSGRLRIVRQARAWNFSQRIHGI